MCIRDRHNRFHQAAMQMIAGTRLGSKTYLYSCLNFILLKEIAEAISGTSMDVFLDNEFYTPLKLNNMAYLPLRTHKKEDIAPTLKTDFLRSNTRLCARSGCRPSGWSVG